MTQEYLLAIQDFDELKLAVRQVRQAIFIHVTYKIKALEIGNVGSWYQYIFIVQTILLVLEISFKLKRILFNIYFTYTHVHFV